MCHHEPWRNCACVKKKKERRPADDSCVAVASRSCTSFILVHEITARDWLDPVCTATLPDRTCNNIEPPRLLFLSTGVILASLVEWSAEQTNQVSIINFFLGDTVDMHIYLHYMTFLMCEVWIHDPWWSWVQCWYYCTYSLYLGAKLDWASTKRNLKRFGCNQARWKPMFAAHKWFGFH